MRSPFPGMDPYIEVSSVWGDFHGDLIQRVKYDLARALPARYRVRSEERSYLVLVESEGKKEHAFVPDVRITTRRKGGKPPGKKTTAILEPKAADEESIVLRAFVTEEHRERFLEIRDTAGEHRLVTTIEVLSLSNKRPNSTGRELYLRKRQSALLGETNLVEIDLLRGGERMPMLDTWPDSPYVLMVARAGQADRCRVWPGHFEKPLPRIDIPLLEPDADIPLDLQPIIDAIYIQCRYAGDIDYSKPLKPALKATETAWLKQQLRARKS